MLKMFRRKQAGNSNSYPKLFRHPAYPGEDFESSLFLMPEHPLGLIIQVPGKRMLAF